MTSPDQDLAVESRIVLETDTSFCGILNLNV